MSTLDVPGGGGNPPAEITSGGPPIHYRTDRITALQDGIDSLSLAMFEALRGLRDAVAPESGNLGGAPPRHGGDNDPASGSANSSNVNSPGENEFEEFVQLYQNGDPETVAMVKRVTPTPPQRAEDLKRIHARIAKEKDAELVKKLASTVLEKSADIDLRVSNIPGMHRTRSKQMKYIEELLEKNREVGQKLDDAYRCAEERRDQVRRFVKEHTCEALGIVEDSIV
jgi:hypothetical protein